MTLYKFKYSLYKVLTTVDYCISDYLVSVYLKCFRNITILELLFIKIMIKFSTINIVR